MKIDCWIRPHWFINMSTLHITLHWHLYMFCFAFLFIVELRSSTKHFPHRFNPCSSFPPQNVNWGAPASLSRGRVSVAQVALSNTSHPRLLGRSGTHAIATKLWEGQRKRSGRQGLDPQQPAVSAQPDPADSRSDSRETHTGTWEVKQRLT